MIAFAAGILFACASAAGLVVMVLMIGDVLRQRRAAKHWRPSPTRRDGDGPI